MKRIAFILTAIILGTGLSFCQQNNNQDTKKNKKLPEITFKTTEHDFGELPYKGDGTYEFEFKNTGKEPLIIKNVKSSCGCTVPSWTREPIKKGKTGTIKVKYDTKRQGTFTKHLTVQSNASNSPVQLTIKGKIGRPSPEEMKELQKMREEQAAKRRAIQQRKQQNQNGPERQKQIPQK